MDKFHTYRPMLDLIGISEGTDKRKNGRAARGYNETLSYGAYTGGDVDLVSMTLAEIDALQTRMLRHPANKWNSSALGRYQIVRTTLRSIVAQLGIPSPSRFDKEMQDRMACYLLGVRGIDKWLSGRLSDETMLLNLAKEWASLPTPQGRGYYGGQNSSVTVSQVMAALNEVRARHLGEQPETEVVVPPAVEKEAEKAERNNWWQWLTALPLAGVGSFYRDNPEVAWLATGGIVVVAIVALVGGRRLVQRVKEIADEVRS